MTAPLSPHHSGPAPFRADSHVNALLTRKLELELELELDFDLYLGLEFVYHDNTRTRTTKKPTQANAESLGEHEK